MQFGRYVPFGGRINQLSRIFCSETMFDRSLVPAGSWAVIFIGFAFLVSAPVLGASIVPAAKSEWIYYYQDSHQPGYTGVCFSADQPAAEGLVAQIQADNGWCTSQFVNWHTMWPDTEGATDVRATCPPVGVPYSYFVQHRETRQFRYSVRTTCSQAETQSVGTIERHFFYYCADSESHELFYPPYGSGPKIPACRLKAGKADPDKQSRDRCPKNGDACEGNPIDVATGNKFQRELDYLGSGYVPLVFERHYNSNGSSDSSLGSNWRHNYSRRVERIDLTSVASIARVYRPDGRILTFDNMSGGWKAQPDIAARLTRTSSPDGWSYTDENDTIETYDDTGRLLSIATRAGAITTLSYDVAGLLTTVSDPHGRQLSFQYDVSARISVLTIPGGGTYQYGYDAAGNLSTVTDPDLKVRTYLYNEPTNTGGTALPHALTGIVDEDSQRFATWQYDVMGRAIRSEHASGADRVDAAYNVDGTVTVTDALGAVRTHTLITKQGVRKIASISGTPCRDCGQAVIYVYGSNGLLNDWRDARNTLFARRYTTDGRNLPTGEWKAAGVPGTQNTSYTWHPAFRLPTTITTGNRRISFTHDAAGNVLTRNMTDAGVTPNVSRTWTYTYDSYGQMLTADGPRTDVADVTTYTYYNCTAGHQCGQVQTITNALNHTTTYNTYNAHGQPLTITDPNGVVTTLTYDLRQRLTSRTVGTELTSFTYWPTGLLKKATLPDGSYLEYTYDAAHRLTDINDAENNRVHYTLDAMGNRTNEEVFDPSNALTQTRTRVFNTLNQLWKEIGAAGTPSVTTEFGYDNNGNPTSINAPLTRNTGQTYDELNRLTQVTDPATGLTKYGYNALDQLISVTDPRNKVTSYTYNALGDLTQQVSPDTGTTINTYDSAGNLQTKTDARSKTGTYSYDALNRVTQLIYPDQTIAYTYDQGSNALGRLSGLSDASGSTAWGYDSQGRVTSRQQVIGGLSLSVGYSYTTAGQLQSTTLPSGNAITYGYTNGKVTSLTLNGSTTLLANVLYQPFGPTSGWTWGNATLAVREYDTDGKVTDIDSAGLKGYAYDDAFRITGITDADDPNLSQTYGYDSLDRLTSASGTGLNQSWTYDANGNRLTQGGSQASTYAIATANNRVSSIGGSLTRTYGYDAAGNITSDGTATFTYDDSGRMISVVKAGVTTSYKLNALGQRVSKTTGGVGTYFAYDEAGHLVGEYDNAGGLIQETIWFEDIPVAVLKSNGSGGVNVFYVHTDHLNTPRKITRPSDNAIVWRWDSDPFGSTSANEDPDGDTQVFAFSLRFPGQYYDSETGLYYNYFRDYDPQTGRYVQSDPIGLDGGINTYAYALNNPLLNIDPTGQESIPLPRPIPVPGWAGPAGAVAGAGWAGWEFGSAIYPHIAEPLGDLIDNVCAALNDDLGKRCDKQLKRDGATCRAVARAERAGKRPVGAGARCWASASQRYGNCLAGRDLGPLDTWNN